MDIPPHQGKAANQSGSAPPLTGARSTGRNHSSASTEAISPASSTGAQTRPANIDTRNSGGNERTRVESFMCQSDVEMRDHLKCHRYQSGAVWHRQQNAGPRSPVGSVLIHLAAHFGYCREKWEGQVKVEGRRDAIVDPRHPRASRTTPRSPRARPDRSSVRAATVTFRRRARSTARAAMARYRPPGPLRTARPLGLRP